MKKDQKIKTQNYQNRVNSLSSQSKIGANIFYAFAVGGLICAIAELITIFLVNYTKIEKDSAIIVQTIIMVALAAILTGIGVYDSIGKVAGAGSIVPITGFANSIVAPAMEFKQEGFVMGVGAKMFIIAGPVLVYGYSTSIIIGIIYYIFFK